MFIDKIYRHVACINIKTEVCFIYILIHPFTPYYAHGGGEIQQLLLKLKRNLFGET